MKQFFNVDNIMFRGISKWMDYVYVSVLWFVFSIPLITMGAAASALYHTSGQCLRHDRGYIFRSFWSCFKNSFRQSAAAVVILAVLFGAIHLDMNLIRGQDKKPSGPAGSGQAADTYGGRICIPIYIQIQVGTVPDG